MSAAVRATLVCMLVGAAPAVAGAQEIVVGPYTFPDESPFADEATFHPTPLTPHPVFRWTPPSWFGGTDDERMLIGFTPHSGMINLGSNLDPGGCWPCYIGRELLDFGFVDVPAVNGPGPDIVIFDARWSSDDYEVAVRPRGGELTEFRFHLIEDQRPTDFEGPAMGVYLWGVEIDLTEYGIPPGVEVDLVQIAGDQATQIRPRADGVYWSEADPVMAAVLNAPCDCDDGDECTWDCGLGGSCASTPHDPGTPCSAGVCDGAPSPACVECLEDAHCPSERPRCDAAERVCVECLDDGDCEVGECTEAACVAGRCESTARPGGAPCSEGVCDGAGACVPCVEDRHCDDGDECTEDRCGDAGCESSPLPAGAPCSEGTCDGDGRCIQCESDADCGELTPFCTFERRCVACLADEHCAAAECGNVTCVSGECRVSAHPSGTPCDGGVCNGAIDSPACVECLRDEDCDLSSFCDPTGRCASCRDDGDCDDRDPCTRDLCDPSAAACRHEMQCRDAGAGPAPPQPGCGCSQTTSAPPSWLALALLAALLAYRRGGTRGTSGPAPPRRG